MNARVLCLLLAAPLAGLTAGDGGRAANVPEPSGRMVLLQVEPDELVRYLAKVIQEELKDAAPKERSLTKARAVSVLIASHAQHGRGARDVWQRAALRDNALKVEALIREGKIDAARRQAGALFDLQAAGRADARKVDLRQVLEHYEAELLMGPRKRLGLGIGLQGDAGPLDGIERRVMILARKPPTEAEAQAQSADLARAALVLSAMAGLLEDHTPEKGVGPKNPKDWESWTGQMRAAAEQLEGAARAKDPKAIQAAARTVNESCNNCHMVFRD
jgi:hypothetical protein